MPKGSGYYQAIQIFLGKLICNSPTNHVITSTNSLRYKIIDLRELLDCVDIDFISISETKLDESFPSAQFHTDSYFLFRRDRNKHGGGLAAFVKSGLLPKCINELESDKIEILAVEINIDERKWIILNVYKCPESNVDNFMEETGKIPDKTFSKCHCIILMGDINIESNETEQTKTASKLLKELCITYDLYNLVTESTCSTCLSAIDVILTNCKYNFMHSKASETNLSDFHKIVCTFM